MKQILVWSVYKTPQSLFPCEQNEFVQICQINRSEIRMKVQWCCGFIAYSNIDALKIEPWPYYYDRWIEDSLKIYIIFNLSLVT